MLVAATLGDQVHGDVLAGKRPQPRLLPVDSPAGLIRRDRPACADSVDQRLISRRKRSSPDAAIACTTPPAVTWIPNLPSARAVFCGRQAQLLVELGRERDRSRTEHRRRPRPERPRSETGGGPDADVRNNDTSRHAPRTVGAPAAARAARPDTGTRCAHDRSPRRTHTAARTEHRAPHQPPPAAHDEHAGRARYQTDDPDDAESPKARRARTAPPDACPHVVPPPADPRASRSSPATARSPRADATPHPTTPRSQPPSTRTAPPIARAHPPARPEAPQPLTRSRQPPPPNFAAGYITPAQPAKSIPTRQLRPRYRGSRLLVPPSRAGILRGAYRGVARVS